MNWVWAAAWVAYYAALFAAAWRHDALDRAAFAAMGWAERLLARRA